jgi:23S rRNA maturation mini-RNase III
MELRVEQVVEPADFERILEKAKALISTLPEFDESKMRQELIGMAVPEPMVRTLQQLMTDYSRTQSYLDRVTSIYMDAHLRCKIMKVITNLLTEGWMKFSKESSDSKRAGEAKLKMYAFIVETERALSFFATVERISNNLTDKMRKLRNQQECMQQMARLQESYNPTPDFSTGESSHPSDRDIFDTVEGKK